MKKREGKRAHRANKEYKQIISQLFNGEKLSLELAESMNIRTKRLGMIMRPLILRGIVTRFNYYNESTLTAFKLTEPFKCLAGALGTMNQEAEIQQILTEMIERLNPIIEESLVELWEHKENLTDSELAFWFGGVGKFMHTFCNDKIPDYDERMKGALVEVMSDTRIIALMSSFNIFGV